MIYKGGSDFPSQIYTDIQRTEHINENLDQFFSQNFLGELPINGDQLVNIVHAPFSQPHLVRINEENKDGVRPLLKADGSNIQTYDNAQKIGIPISKVIQNEFLAGVAMVNLNKLGITMRLPEPRQTMYGDFQPVQIFGTNSKDGIGLDPKLFLISFLSELAVEQKQMHLKSGKNLVIHTDFLYFMSEGHHDKVRENLVYINQLAKTFGLTIAIENNEISKNQVFQDAVPWGVDPEDIAKKIVGLDNLGICVDIKHCIFNGLSPSEIKSKLAKLHSLNIPLIIHSRSYFSEQNEFKDLTSYIFSNAIPIAYEP